MPEKKIVIAAGGTGGHIYPGIALAAELRSRGWDPVFIMRNNDIGKAILDKAGFAYFAIPSMGFPRRPSLKLCAFPFVLAAGLIKSAALLKTLKPAVVVGMGGYISFPAVISAKLLAIPTVIHEQNALPGMTNRLLSRFADSIALSFEGSKEYFKSGRAAVTGNPVRKEVFTAEASAARREFGLAEGKFTVLVFGGSQGAAGINKAAAASFGFLGDIEGRVQFLHISGQASYDAVKAQYEKNSIPGTVVAYTHSMGQAYAVSDLIICRAGATTAAELKILNKPAILIPFPYATANHQEYNARALEKSSGAQVVLERDITPEVLAGLIIKAFKSAPAGSGLRPPEVFPQERLADLVISHIR